MNKGRLNKVEKYVIEQMAQEGNNIASIAEFLDRSESSVKKYMSSLPTKEEPKKEKKKRETFFVNRTASKKDKSVSIMTEAESSRSDDAKPKRQGTINKYKSAIHMITEEDDG